jgi:hypothetical protein
MGMTLATLMDETQARYPNQMLLPGTPEMYLAEWEEMAQRYGLEGFRAGLLKAIREPERHFFPAPEDIRAHCACARRQEREREETLRVLKQEAEWKARCERERAEDAAAGRVPTAQEMRLDAILKVASEKPLRVPMYQGPPATVLTPEEIKERVARELQASA